MGLFVFLLLNYMDFYIIWLQILYQIYVLWIFPSACNLFFLFLSSIFWWAEMANFYKLQYNFFLYLVLLFFTSEIFA